jgi:hypothetical protein
MAHPFMPMKARKLRKLTREREESNLTVTVFNRPVEFETPAVESHRNEINSRPKITCQSVTEKFSN